ncbi:MAG: PorT family protein [Porphyromonadaceae bacterium]|nr:PorT family protein [Porphyromonadaceae bacterium]
MKRSLKIASLLLPLLCTVLPLQAVDFNWGFKGGMNLSGSSYKGLNPSISYDSNLGYYIGPMGELDLPLGFSIDGSVLYLNRSTTFTNTETGSHTNYHRHSLDVPLTCKFTFNPLQALGIFVGVGPSFTFDVKNDNLTKKLYYIMGKDKPFHDDPLIANETSICWNFTAGIILFKHLRAGVNYRQPIRKISTNSKERYNVEWSDILVDNFSYKNKMWQLVFSIAF